MLNTTEIILDISLENIKWIYLSIISFITFLGTFLLPWLFRKCDHYLHYMNGFSGAIMFSTAIIHLIPELDNSHLNEYPFSFLFIILSFYLVMFIEKIIFHVHHHEVEINIRNEVIKNLTSVFAIGLHALVAGINLGISDNNTTLTHMFVSIITHKIFASYAIGNKMFRSQSKSALVLPLILFNLMTPGGIIIGFYINNINPWLDMVLNSIAIGAFIYIGCSDTIIDEIELNHKHDTTQTSTPNFTRPRTSPVYIKKYKYNKLKLYLAQLLGVAVIATVSIIH